MLFFACLAESISILMLLNIDFRILPVVLLRARKLVDLTTHVILGQAVSFVAGAGKILVCGSIRYKAL